MSATTVPHWLSGQGAFPEAAFVGRAARPRSLAPGSGLEVELAAMAEAAHCRAAWQDLSARALEPNVFLEPAFALAAAQHFAISQRPKFVIVWQKSWPGAARRLIGLCPVQAPRFAGAGAASVWISKQAALGVPLLDRDEARAALQAIVDFIGSRRIGAPALLFGKVPQAGKTAALIRELAAASGRALDLSGQHRRAALTSGAAGAAALTAQPSKKLKELRRQRRRMEDGGVVEFASVSAPDKVRAAIEHFLALEAKGWKGAQGSAFLSSPGQTAFLRSLTRDMARQGKCRVDMLLRGGAPVAMGIVLTSGGQAAFWKTAYDETCAAYSPGVQLCLEISRLQTQDDTIAATDSCAIADHPMIDKLWPERIEIADMLLSVRPGAQRRFAFARARLRAARGARALAKRIFHSLRKGKIS